MHTDHRRGSSLFPKGVLSGPGSGPGYDRESDRGHGVWPPDARAQVRLQYTQNLHSVRKRKMLLCSNPAGRTAPRGIDRNDLNFI